MTTEEAIKELSVEYLGESERMIKAKKMAIKALKQEPCEDWHDVPSYEMTLEQARQAVKDLRKKLAEYLWEEPCNDAVSRSDVMVLIEDTNLKHLSFARGISQKAFEDLLNGTQSLPSVTPQQKIGKWIRVDKDKLRCSECEVIHFIAQYPQSAKINFCPNCGRKMMQEVEER